MRGRRQILTAPLGAVVLGALLCVLVGLPSRSAAQTAQVESKVPSAAVQEMLIKTYLIALNNANLTGNYTVLQERLSKPFREQFDAARLKKIFKSFADKQVDFGIIAAKPPVPTTESKIDERGALILRGYFDTEPTRVLYDLAFIPSEHKWKPVKLQVNLKRVDNKK